MKQLATAVCALLLAAASLAACGSSSIGHPSAASSQEMQLVRAQEAGFTFNIPADWIVLRGWTTNDPTRAAKIAELERLDPGRLTIAQAHEVFAMAPNATNRFRFDVATGASADKTLAELRARFAHANAIIDTTNQLVTPLGPAEVVVFHFRGGNVYVDGLYFVGPHGMNSIEVAADSPSDAEALMSGIIRTLTRTA